jgi:hypothetical protein
MGMWEEGALEEECEQEVVVNRDGVGQVVIADRDEKGSVLVVANWDRGG